MFKNIYQKSLYKPGFLSALVLALLLSTSLDGLAQNRLFSDYEGSLDSKQKEVHQNLLKKSNHERVKLVTLDKSLLSRNQFVANMFPGHAPLITYFDIGASGVSFPVWTGKYEGLGSATFLINGDRISAHISSSTGNFELFPLDNGVHAIVQYDNSKWELCGDELDRQMGKKRTQPAGVMPHNDNAHKQSPDPQSLITGDDPMQTQANGEECFVRVIAGYTAGAEANTISQYNRTILEHVALCVAETNTGYANSQVEQRMEIAYLYEVTQAEGSNSATDVSNLRTTTDGRWDEIHTYRNQYDGDMCALITDGTYSGLCGRANGFSYTDPNNFFQVSEYDCIVGNFTFAHEFGHCQGCRHDNDGTGSPFTYARGYNQGSVFRTIMAVCCSPARVNYWSNPGVTFPGSGVTGTSTRDNARALDVGDAVYASHRTTPATFTLLDDVQNQWKADMITSTSLLVSTDATNDFDAQSGSEVDLSSYGSVSLRNGFHARNGSRVHVYISNTCPGTTYARAAEPGIANTEVSRPDADVKINPEQFNLSVSPNPFDDMATLAFDLPQSSVINMYLVNTLGQQVKLLISGQSYEAGSHKIQLQGSGMTEGIYYCIMESADQQLYQKVVISH